MSNENPVKVLLVSGVMDEPELHLFKGLAEAGFKVDVISDPAERRQQLLRDSGINVRDIHILHRFDFIRARIIRQQIIENDYDVVYALFNRGLAAVILATRGLKCKIVGYRGTLGNISYLDPGCWVAHLHPRMRLISCNCKAVRKYLFDFGLPEDKLLTIYKGHKVEWYQGEVPTKVDGLDLPSDAFVIGCVANVRELKGIDYIIKALSLLPEQIHLVVVGHCKGNKYQKLAAKLGVSERVHFLGFRRDASAIARIFKIAIMASTRREGIPRSIIEAMSQGIPAVVTTVGGLPELVPDKKAGLNVPPKDSQALANAILTLYNDPEKRAEYGAGAIDWIKTRFNADDTLKTYIKVFKDLAEEKRRDA